VLTPYRPLQDSPRGAVVSGGMLTATSLFEHAETVARLRDAISRNGLTVFAEFDHAAGARAAGMDLSPELVVVFGNPRAGTPLMQSDPRVGIELPLRMLVWNQAGQTLVGDNDPRELAGPYDLTAQAATLQAMASLLQRLAAEAVGGEQHS